MWRMPLILIIHFWIHVIDCMIDIVLERIWTTLKKEREGVVNKGLGKISWKGKEVTYGIHEASHDKKYGTDWQLLRDSRKIIIISCCKDISRTLGQLRVHEVTTNDTNCNNPTYIMNKENVIIDDTEERAHEFNNVFVDVGPPRAKERSFQTATIRKEFTSNSYNQRFVGSLWQWHEIKFI